MRNTPPEVQEYLDSLPQDRREIAAALRAQIVDNMRPGIEECVRGHFLSYSVSREICPEGYHCDPRQPLGVADIANQKAFVGFYGFCIYGDGPLRQEFLEGWTASGKKMDMGAACVRIKKLEDVPLEVVGRLFAHLDPAEFTARYRAILAENRAAAKERSAAKKAAKGQPGT